MAVQKPGDVFGSQWSTSVDKSSQSLIMAVQAVSARSLYGRSMQKCSEKRFTLIDNEQLRASLPRAGHQLTRTTLGKDFILMGNCLRTSSYVGQESCHDPRRRGFLCGKELRIGPACGSVAIVGRLQSPDGIKQSEGSTIVQEIWRRPEGGNGKKTTVPTSRARELKGDVFQVGHGGGNLHLPSNCTTSEAIAILKSRQEQGNIVDSYTFVEVLNRCSKQKDLTVARQVHDCVIQSGMDKNPYVANTLMNVYLRCGNLQDARRMFDGLEKKTIVTWSIMIAGYAADGHVEDALEVFNRMRQEGAQPDELTCLSILKACASPLALKWGKQVHAYVLHAGLESDVRIGTALVQMYTKCRCITEARRVFENLGTYRNLITWNVMIGAYSKSGCGVEAYRLFLQMQREGFIPDSFTYVGILNASASAGAIEWVKNVHSHARKAGLDSNVRVGNALVHMYAKSGSIDTARVIFDRLKTRDRITWNMMIGGYAGSGDGVKAYRLFLEMQREGFTPDAITYVSILNANASAGALDWVKEVHTHACKAGLDSDVRVGNVLVHMYAKSGSIPDARHVFDRLKRRDAFTWNMMIGAYAESGRGIEAYRLFLQMQQEGFIPDAITYVSILNASASTGALEWVKEVHNHARKSGLDSDLRVGSVLVHMYAKSGSVDDARLTFDGLKTRDVITWNMIISAHAASGEGVEAYRLFLQMQREGFMPDAITYVSILNASASAGALDWVKEVHNHARKAGLDSDLLVGNVLIHMYAKSGSIGDARLLFDRLKRRDVITWNMIIGAYAESGDGVEAYRLFLQMQREGFIPQAVTYVSILNANASAGALDWVKEVHNHAHKAGLDSDVRVGNVLVHMYAKCGSIPDAQLIFDRLQTRDVITWNTMVGAYAESGDGVEAYRLFLQMQREGFTPDRITYVSILNASASAGALEWVKEVHIHAREGGLESDLRVGNALVRMYAKSGSIDDARNIFDRLKTRDVITWNIMIDGLSQHGCGHEALELFRKMNAHGLKPDETTFVAVLTACCYAGLLDDGRRLFLAMKQDYSVDPTVVHYTCLVDLLGRAGHLDEAKLLIGDMPVEPDGIIWGALLGACRIYGNVELGELATTELLKLEPKDASAYVLLSNIYAGAGKWEKVSSLRTTMQDRGVRKEPGRSWIEVDNKIHDFLARDTAHPEAKAIYAELNNLTEKLKSQGYTPDTQLVLKNIDEEDKELALCSHSEKLAIVYGLMHTPHGKPIRVYKNLRVCSDCHMATKLISKVTGREIIARDLNRFHHFKGGLCSCGDYW